MRVFLILIPMVLAAQTPAPKPAPAKPAVRRPAASPAAKKSAAGATPPTPMTDDQKTVYALGLSIHRSLAQFDLSPADLDLIKRALTDAAAGKPAVDLNQWGPKIQELARARAAKVAERQKSESLAYLTKAAAQPGAVKTTSGLVYRELKPGTGPHPKPSDSVKVHYRGTFIDGTEFDSSFKRNEPAEFQLSQVVRCWTEGVQMMGVGGKSMLVCPSDLAYGDQGRPGIPGGATLVFEIELLGVAPPK